MTYAYLEKLESAGKTVSGFALKERTLLLKLCEDVRPIEARRDIIREGECPDHVNLMIEGWACRYKVLRNGSRQITAFLLPGDFCDAHITMFTEMDHSIAAINECKVAFVSRAKILEISEHPQIARALWWASLVDEAVLRAWIVNLGRRDAFDRVGHLICELYARLKNVGRAGEGEFELPLTQEELADALGLTSVHVNRTLKRLREEKLLTLHHRQLVITDMARLQRIVGFNPNYLHLPRNAGRLNSV